MAAPYSLEGDTTGLPRTSRRNVAYEIESISPRFNRVPRASQTVVVCRVLWPFVGMFVEDMVGKSWRGNIGSTVSPNYVLRRYLPEKNPFDPKQWCTRCEEVEQGGGKVGRDGNTAVGPGADPVSRWPVPAWVKFRITFESLPFDLATDAQVDADSNVTERELYRYLFRSRKPKAKEQQVPGGGMKVVGSPTTVLMNTFFKRVIMADVQYTHFRLPVADLPLSSWDACLGCFNNATFDLGPEGGYAFDTGTLLYLGYDDTDKYWDASGDWVCDVVHFFEFRDAGWNFFLTKTGAFVEVSSDGTAGGTKPYSGADLDTIFRIA